jgi:hypothetical protein
MEVADDEKKKLVSRASCPVLIFFFSNFRKPLLHYFFYEFYHLAESD